ncbi:unnamed protein product (macronuclear) [Paramecium tetraurelia]|uniref:Uncharacterized protein n=1 Tax=Paramecium tetraurelia TaxID=5888 RepID=A0D6N1_PARTE|nr:uncharacterized protein GSPATT00001739001 [Paramecium tetraurelia]CAK78698.1 unnamed protein product [Paramecium tetraurelia]|eukprot:XP_001446095.1 hypothetical protein (macronuclear) [Paramecium tetraurelia strain d4-2]
MKIQIVDSAAKIYKAFDESDSSKCVRFKFFTNYMLVENQRLKIFDFSETVLYYEDHKKFIIARINEFTSELEIHIADSREIKENLDSIDQGLLEIQSQMKESIEMQKFKKIVSIDLKDDLFIIVMTDRLLTYCLASLIRCSSEKVSPQAEVLFYPILVSFKPYVSAYTFDTLYLFQKIASYRSKTNQLMINYKIIDFKHSDKPQCNQKISFQSPQVAQSTETMLSFIKKVRIQGKNQLHLSICTQFKNQTYIQKVVHEFGETLIIKQKQQYFKQSDVHYIQSISNKSKESKVWTK